MKFETNKEFMENLSLHCLRASTIFLHASGSLKVLHDFKTQFAQYLRPNIKSSTTLKQIKYLANAQTFGTLQVQTSIFSCTKLNTYLGRPK